MVLLLTWPPVGFRDLMIPPAARQQSVAFVGGGRPMTEAEWLACADAMPLLEHLRDKASKRKHRLFASGCVRRIWQSLHAGGEVVHRAVEIGERLADEVATDEEIASLFRLLDGRMPYRTGSGPTYRDLAEAFVDIDTYHLAT